MLLDIHHQLGIGWGSTGKLQHVSILGHGRLDANCSKIPKMYIGPARNRLSVEISTRLFPMSFTSLSPVQVGTIEI